MEKQDCINKFVKTEHALRMKEYLISLAATGFVAIPPEVSPYTDPVCQWIVVKRTGAMIGLAKDVWNGEPILLSSPSLLIDFLGKFQYGLAPEKQSLRLVIAEQLADDN